ELSKTNEELSKTNEELSKTNEELSKTNEELSKMTAARNEELSKMTAARKLVLEVYGASLVEHGLVKKELDETNEKLKKCTDHNDSLLVIIKSYKISDLYSELSSTMCNLGDLGDIMASLVQEHPTIVEKLQRFELYTNELKTQSTSLEERVEDLKSQCTNVLNNSITLSKKLAHKNFALEKKLAQKNIALEKKLAHKDIASVFDYLFIFILIVMGMVLGVFHEPATNVIAYIGTTALYIVRQLHRDGEYVQVASIQTRLRVAPGGAYSWSADLMKNCDLEIENRDLKDRLRIQERIQEISDEKVQWASDKCKMMEILAREASADMLALHQICASLKSQLVEQESRQRMEYERRYSRAFEVLVGFFGVWWWCFALIAIVVYV
ncbi:hypothetical protein T484DRAFT_1869039, partial [Baffinella frigidus]